MTDDARARNGLLRIDVHEQSFRALLRVSCWGVPEHVFLLALYSTPDLLRCATDYRIREPATEAKANCLKAHSSFFSCGDSCTRGEHQRAYAFLIVNLFGLEIGGAPVAVRRDKGLRPPRA